MAKQKTEGQAEVPATIEEMKPPATLNELFTSEYVKNAIKQAAPKHLDAARFLRIANMAVKRVPKLRECTLPSLWNCMVQLTMLGLEPDGRRAHLIPYGKECTLIVDYKGIVECVRRSGEVSDIHADIVCENDKFDENMGRVTEHKVDRKKERGEMYAAYSYVKFKDGTESYEIMSKSEIDSIRKRSKAANAGPWVTDYNEMAKKTCFRRHSKWLPWSSEIRTAIEADDEALFPDIAETISADDIKAIPNGTKMKIRKSKEEPIVEAETEEEIPNEAMEPEEKETNPESKLFGEE